MLVRIFTLLRLHHNLHLRSVAFQAPIPNRQPTSMQSARWEPGDPNIPQVFEVTLDLLEYRFRWKPTGCTQMSGITNSHTPMWGILVAGVMICFIWETGLSRVQDHCLVQEVIGVQCAVISNDIVRRPYDECMNSRQGFLGTTQLTEEEIVESGNLSLNVTSSFQASDLLKYFGCHHVVVKYFEEFRRLWLASILDAPPNLAPIEVANVMLLPFPLLKFLL